MVFFIFISFFFTSSEIRPESGGGGGGSLLMDVTTVSSSAGRLDCYLLIVYTLTRPSTVRVPLHHYIKNHCDNWIIAVEQNENDFSLFFFPRVIKCTKTPTWLKKRSTVNDCQVNSNFDQFESRWIYFPFVFTTRNRNNYSNKTLITDGRLYKKSRSLAVPLIHQ